MIFVADSRSPTQQVFMEHILCPGCNKTGNIPPRGATLCRVGAVSESGECYGGEMSRVQGMGVKWPQRCSAV